MNKNRLEAFSDGMFAIIMTIMILDLKAPHGGKINDLLSVLPAFLCYAQSFLFAGVYWSNHHHLIHTVKKVTGPTIVANLGLLFWLSLIPFVTSWVAECNFAPQAVALYALLLAMPGFFWTILMTIIKKNNPWSERMQEAMKRQEKKGYISLFLYLSGIPLAFVNPFITEALFLLVGIMWFIPDKNIERAMEE
ncbi:MAG TPA: TMEM175 family protein [Bacteroidia bacterium]|jgi:uncharacterized membrane protein|nr:TMEM175 family protein [Bacteroidia bacterium]